MLNILIIGWFNIPHSYAIVNCFQTIHLLKKYNQKLNIYIKEYKYFTIVMRSFNDNVSK